MKYKIENILISLSQEIFNKNQNLVFYYIKPYKFVLGQIKNVFHLNFFYDVGNKLKATNKISSKQFKLSLDLLEKYKVEICNILKLDQNLFEDTLKNKITDLELYESKIFKNEAKYVGNNLICLKFSYNQDVIDTIKNIRNSYNLANFDYSNNILYFYDHKQKIWFIEILGAEISLYELLFEKFNFSVDDEIKEFFKNMKENKNNVGIKVIDEKIDINYYSDILIERVFE